MLVLARKLNEKILIGEDIEITVVGISGDSIRLGINAPRAVKILRSEVYEDIQRQNKDSVMTNSQIESLQKLIMGKGELYGEKGEK